MTRLVPLLLRSGHPLPGGPLGLGNLGLRGFPRGHGRLIGGSRRGQRLRLLRIGLQRRGPRLFGVSLGVLAALLVSAAMPARRPQRNSRAAQILRLGHPAALAGQLLAPQGGGKAVSAVCGC